MACGTSSTATSAAAVARVRTEGNRFQPLATTNAVANGITLGLVKQASVHNDGNQVRLTTSPAKIPRGCPQRGAVEEEQQRFHHDVVVDGQQRGRPGNECPYPKRRQLSQTKVPGGAIVSPWHRDGEQPRRKSHEKAIVSCELAQEENVDLVADRVGGAEVCALGESQSVAPMARGIQEQKEIQRIVGQADKQPQSRAEQNQQHDSQNNRTSLGQLIHTRPGFLSLRQERHSIVSLIRCGNELPRTPERFTSSR